MKYYLVTYGVSERTNSVEYRTTPTTITIKMHPLEWYKTHRGSCTARIDCIYWYIEITEAEYNMYPAIQSK